MQTDQLYLAWGIIGLNLSILCAHALRSRLTLAPVFALAGVFAMMLWQILQMGWWVDAGPLRFNAGLIAFIPPLLLGGLLCYALDGLRVSRAYLLAALTISMFSWGFSLFREQLGAYVPLPYTLTLSSREHLSIIFALIVAQLAALAAYQILFRRISVFAMIPAIFIGISTWLAAYSSVAYGFATGSINFRNELPEFLAVAALGAILLLPYALYVRQQNLLMPVGSLLRFFRFWRAARGNEIATENDALNPEQAISELQLLNTTLRQQQKLIDNQMEHTPLGILFLDARNRITRSNPAAIALLGAGATVGQNLNDSIRALGIDHFSIKALAQTNQATTFDYQNAERYEQWLEIMLTPLFNNEKSAQLIGYHVQLKDVTNETRSRRRATIAQRLQGLHETGRVITHDFSNLLLGAEAQLECLSNGLDTPAQTEARNAIRTAFAHARGMLRQLGAGSQFGTPVLHPLQLNTLLGDAIAIAAAAAAERGVSIHRTASPTLLVEGDQAQLLRVFTNLIHNAVRACEKSGGEIDIHANAEGRGAQIEISDTGCGMTDEQLATAFDPGFSTKGGGQGGLGLAISYLMIEAHGGHIAIDHNPAGRGTRARIWLPTAGLCQEIVHLDNENVILLLDDENTRQLLATQLAVYQSCQVAETENIDEALALIDEEKEWRHLVTTAALFPESEICRLPASIELHRIGGA
jgi:signal transduction histidine kinase